MWVSLMLSWVVRGCKSWVVESNEALAVQLPRLVADPKEVEVAVWAGLTGWESQGGVSVNMHEDGELNFEDFDFEDFEDFGTKLLMLRPRHHSEQSKGPVIQLD